MKKALIVIAVLAIALGISWVITVGILKLISICFGVGFSLPVATGIWLILCLVQSIFSKSSKD